MRTVTFGMNISIDGYCDHTSFNPSEDVHDFFTAMLNDVDLLFFGRVMYELMFPYWSDVARDRSGTEDENKFADKITGIDKVVVSRTLNVAEGNMRIVRNNPAAELLQLKKQQGRNISVDSLSMLPELLSAELIDEIYLIVHPVMVGRGRRLLDFGNIQENFNFKLIDTRTFRSGCVLLHYRYVKKV